MEHLREGDVVIIWKLDRLGRSLKDLIDLVSKFKCQPETDQSLAEVLA